MRQAAEKRADLEKRKREAERRMLSEDEAETAQKIVDSREKAEALAGKVSSIKQAIQARETEFSQAKATKLGSLHGQLKNCNDLITEKSTAISHLLAIKGAECPTCLRTLAAKDKTALGLKLDGEVNELKSQAAAIANQIGVAAAEVPDAAATAKLRSQLEQAEKDLASIGEIANSENRMRIHREAIVEAARCDRELKAVAEPVAPDTAAMLEKIEDLNARIGKGEAILEQVREIERGRSGYESWKLQKVTLEARVQILERLIEFFGPNGIKTKLVGDKIGPFTEAINNALEPFGYQTRFTLEPYSFLVGSPETALAGPRFHLSSSVSRSSSDLAWRSRSRWQWPRA